MGTQCHGIKGGWAHRVGVRSEGSCLGGVQRVNCGGVGREGQPAKPATAVGEERASAVNEAAMRRQKLRHAVTRQSGK